MQKQICNYLNRPFPLFLALRKGRIYFIGMIFIMVVLANVLQPFGLINSHEFHKGLVLTDYIVVFFGMYALLYLILSSLRPHHYNTDTWTLGKEFQVLLLFFPSTVCISCLFANFTIPEFNLTLNTFRDIQLYNGLLSVVSIPTFGYFIQNQLKPTDSNSAAKRNAPDKPGENSITSAALEATGDPDEQQTRKILQKLQAVMETEQLYLSNKCNLQLVSEHTGIPVHRISITINTFSGCSFTDFVNKYRVEHVCRILQEGNQKRLKLEAIGMECGFGSKVNFYTVFKKVIGKTPAEYLAGL
jgi:AraC-like DNA-binding protein